MSATTKDIASQLSDALFKDFDVEKAASLMDPDYIQHNPTVPTGAGPILGFIPMLKDSKIKATSHRCLEEDGLVVFHTTYENAQLFGGEVLVAFDIFRVKDGKVMEHWDNLQPLSGPNTSGHTMTDGPTEVTDLDKTAANKKLVTDFLKAVLVEGDKTKIDECVAEGEAYIQHNPMVGDGRDFLKGAMDNLGLKYTKTHIVVAEGNFVFAASEGKMGSDETQAFFDLFRVEDGKLVEHWDVAAPIPAEFKHSNGKF